jgi:hypothetical protein
MSKRTLLAIAGALVLFGAGPAVYRDSAEAAEAADKLNYYRIPGSPGWCEHACDGAACCTTPGGGEEDQ